MTTTTRLHKITAGRYETTLEPENGTIAIYSYKSGGRTTWCAARYDLNPHDGGLDLNGLGDYFATLADAREALSWLTELPQAEDTGHGVPPTSVDVNTGRVTIKLGGSR